MSLKYVNCVSINCVVISLKLIFLLFVCVFDLNQWSLIFWKIRDVFNSFKIVLLYLNQEFFEVGFC